MNTNIYTNNKYTKKIEDLTKRKNSNFSFKKEELDEGIILRIVDTNNNNKHVTHIAYVYCKDDGEELIYLNFIRVEKDFKGTGLSKYVLAYFIGHLIEKYSEIPIQLQNATNNFMTLDSRSCKRMKTQVKSLTDNKITKVPRNSILRSGTVRLDKNYWRKIGFEFKDDDPSEMIYNKKLTDLYKKMVDEIQKELKELNSNMTGGDNKYINTKNGKRKIQVGKRGGKYYMMNNKKIYIK